MSRQVVGTPASAFTDSSQPNTCNKEVCPQLMEFDLITFLLGILAGGVVFGVILFILGVTYRKKVAEKEIGSAEEEAKRIINEAIRGGESKKREMLLEAKEEIHKSRTEYEKEVKERRSELQKQEGRLQQKDESLD